MKETQNKAGRFEHTVKNLFYGAGASVIMTLLPFLSRKLFILSFGETYLGVNSLFYSILSVLSLAELGLGNVVVYSFYKPLGEQDHEKIGSLLAYFKKVYAVISVTVFAAGMALIPFLSFLVKLPAELPYIRLYYILFVLNSACSYQLIYKSLLINADQKQYITSFYQTVSCLVLNGLQILSLLLFRNYTLYLVIQVLITIGTNVVISAKADKMYGLKNQKAEPLPVPEKKKIREDTISMLSYKLGSTFLNSTDSLYITRMISTVTVGFYANYQLLLVVLNKFVDIIYNSIYASVGDLNASEDTGKKKLIFDSLCLIFFYFASVGLSGVAVISGDVIRLLFGEAFVLDLSSQLAIALSFYFPIILYPVWMYRNTTGIFRETRNIIFYAGVINLILSYVLGKRMGLAGILIATSVARGLSSFWFEPVVVYRKLFPEHSSFEYFGRVLLSLGIGILAAAASHALGTCSFPFLPVKILVKSLVSIVIPSLCYPVCYRNSPCFHYLIGRIKPVVSKKIFGKS